MQFDRPPFGDREYHTAHALGRRLAYFVDEERPSGQVEQSLLLDEIHDLLRTHRAFCYDTTRHQCVLADAVFACYLGVRDGLSDPSRMVHDVVALPVVTPPNASGARVTAAMRSVSAETFVNCAPHPKESLADISREHELWLDDKSVREYEGDLLTRWDARARRLARERELRPPDEALSFAFDRPTPGF